MKRSLRAGRPSGAIGIALLFSSALVAPAAQASDARDFKAGPRNTVVIERHLQKQPRVRVAALKLDPADLSSAATPAGGSRVRTLRRLGPRGTIPRDH